MPKLTNKLYIIRGLPGSGKSNLAEELKQKGLVSYVVEADQFMVDDEGFYKFVPSNLQRCHEECQAWVKFHLDNGENVAVANTFTRIWEMAPYFKMGYPYTIITAKGNFKNIHGVPNQVIENMKQRWQDFADG